MLSKTVIQRFKNQETENVWIDIVFCWLLKTSGIALAKNPMDTATKHAQKAALKIKEQERKSGKDDKKNSCKSNKNRKWFSW